VLSDASVAVLQKVLLTNFGLKTPARPNLAGSKVRPANRLFLFAHASAQPKRLPAPNPNATHDSQSPERLPNQVFECWHFYTAFCFIRHAI
jgi:hypothetical protein